MRLLSELKIDAIQRECVPGMICPAEIRALLPEEIFL